MTEELFFNKLVTKSMQAIQGDERFFEGYLTVEIKDKQGEITVVDELYKVLPIWMDRGAPISDTHSNRIIGKGINYAKTEYKTKDGETYPAIKITGKIHKDYELDNEIWKKIKSGEYKGLSFGGATKSDRDPVRMKDGSIAYSLKDLEHYEVAVCADPAVPLALITDYNPVAKSATNAEVREDGKMIIKCDKFGCYITKPIPDSKGGKGDFDHCEEKNQDKNDPAAFCGAIQHKLEKAIEAGMLQQVVKNGLEIFMTKDELKKVCSACGKTLEEHGVIKYDHSNTMGDQHSMYNQNTGRETWIGQGLPQPTETTICEPSMETGGKCVEQEKPVDDSGGRAKPNTTGHHANTGDNTPAGVPKNVNDESKQDREGKHKQKMAFFEYLLADLSKAEEGQFGAGQRGLGFDKGSVQGSGQSAQITPVKEEKKTPKSI